MTIRASIPLILLFLLPAASASAQTTPPPPEARGETAEETAAALRGTVPSTAPAAAAPTDAPAPPHDEARARAPEEAVAPFGGRGQWVLSSALDAGLSHTGYAETEASYTTFGVTPSIDAFVADCFSIGGFANLSAASSTGYAYGTTLETTTTTSWSAGARFGALLRLGDIVSWWPRVGFTYSASRTSPSAESDGHSLTDRGANFNAFAPLLVHVAPHAFVGLGPSFTRTLSHVQEGYAKTFGNGTIVGGSFLVGGWL